MGKRGPAPKPAELRRLEGNPGKRRLNPRAPQATGVPRCPAHLDDYGKTVWRRVVGAMPPRLYTAADREVLAAYCTAAALHRKAVLAIRREGAVAVGEGGAPYQSPWVGIANRQAGLIASLGSKLGLDPSSRSTLNMPDDGPPKSKFARFTAIPGGRDDRSPA